MYEHFFGLKEKPFNLTPDPDFLYLNKRTREAFEDILSGIERREGFAAVVGDVGTGKTTLCCALLERIEGNNNIRTVLIQNPMLSEMDILRSILQDLGARPENAWPGKADELQALGAAWTRDLTKKELIDCLNAFLAERAREDAFTVLIIDESQNLSLEMLEQLRLLSNLETTKKKLLQIIFLGQLEFKDKLAELRQLDQRISVRFETQALSLEDTEKYIRHRLGVAGGTHLILFARGSFETIHKNSKGYPRLINLICDRSLREAFRAHSFTITKQMVRGAVARLSGKEEVLLKARARRMKIAVAAGLILIAAASVLLFLVGRRMIPAKDTPVDAALQKTAAPVLALPHDEPALLPIAESPAPIKTQEGLEYVLQVYSFRTSETAEGAAKQLKGLNFPAYVSHNAGEGGDGWYVVYAGPFSGLEAARQANSDLQAATGASPILRERVGKEAQAPEAPDVAIKAPPQ